MIDHPIVYKLVKFDSIYVPSLKITQHKQIEFIFPYDYGVDKIDDIQNLSYPILKILPLSLIGEYVEGEWKRSKLHYKYFCIELISSNVFTKYNFCDSLDGLRSITEKEYDDHLSGFRGNTFS